jgi:hypothetical protein
LGNGAKVIGLFAAVKEQWGTMGPSYFASGVIAWLLKVIKELELPCFIDVLSDSMVYSAQISSGGRVFKAEIREIKLDRNCCATAALQALNVKNQGSNYEKPASFTMGGAGIICRCSPWSRPEPGHHLV